MRQKHRHSNETNRHSTRNRSHKNQMRDQEGSRQPSYGNEPYSGSWNRSSGAWDRHSNDWDRDDMADQYGTGRRMNDRPNYSEDPYRRSSRDYENINQSRWNPNFDSSHTDPMAYDRDFAYNRSYDTYNSINDRRNTFENERSGSYNTSGTGFRGKGPKGYERSDERIREEVCDRLADSDMIDASSIEVKVEKGEVTLSGIVEERSQKRAAEDLIESLRGVRDVHNNLRVQSSSMMSSQSESGSSLQSGKKGGFSSEDQDRKSQNQERKVS